MGTCEYDPKGWSAYSAPGHETKVHTTPGYRWRGLDRVGSREQASAGVVMQWYLGSKTSRPFRGPLSVLTYACCCCCIAFLHAHTSIGKVPRHDFDYPSPASLVHARRCARGEPGRDEVEVVLA
jgi:hypothetical protein